MAHVATVAVAACLCCCVACLACSVINPMAASLPFATFGEIGKMNTSKRTLGAAPGKRWQDVVAELEAEGSSTGSLPIVLREGATQTFVTRINTVMYVDANDTVTRVLHPESGTTLEHGGVVRGGPAYTP